MGIIAEMAFFALVLSTFIGYGALLITWKMLKACWQLLVYLYDAIRPELKKAWSALRQRGIEARKPQDIQTSGATARQEINQVLAYYRQQADHILQAEQPSQQPFPKVHLFFEEDYKINNQ